MPAGNATEQWHGSAGGYSYHRCRCRSCTDAWAAARRDYRNPERREAHRLAREAEQRDYMTSSEVGQVYGITREAVRLRLLAGKLPEPAYTKPGAGSGRRMWRRADIQGPAKLPVP